MSAPKPFVGYMVAVPGFAPPPRTKTSWLFQVPPLFYSLPDAIAQYGGDLTQPTHWGQELDAYKVTVTFERIEGKVSP